MSTPLPYQVEFEAWLQTSTRYDANTHTYDLMHEAFAAGVEAGKALVPRSTYSQWYQELIDVIYGERPEGENERPDPRDIVRSLQAQLAAAEKRAKLAEDLAKALNAIYLRRPIIGSTGDYREGQMHALQACREVARAALAAYEGEKLP